MSHELINRNPDLRRLLEAGYELSIRADHLVVDNVPYVNANQEIAFGALVSELTLSGDQTERPGTHVIMFTGEHPCHRSGQPITAISHQAKTIRIDDELVVRHSFSNKPPGGYENYFHKIDTYATIISAPAQSLDPRVTPKTFRPTEAPEGSVFNYLETASGRAGISAISRKLEGERVGIVGLGGTGSYVLDLMAKTPVAEIRVFDHDTFYSHSAFRAPGAPALETLRERPPKVGYFAAEYSRMHRGIVAHQCALDESSVALLKGLGFVFMCIDDAPAKRPIVEFLEREGISFVDTGMGIESYNEQLGGIVRVTVSTPQKRDHFRKRVPMAGPVVDDAYATNIQIAELNALNAALAVIEWKKQLGFYRDLEGKHNLTYTIDGCLLVSEDSVCRA